MRQQQQQEFYYFNSYGIPISVPQYALLNYIVLMEKGKRLARTMEGMSIKKDDLHEIIAIKELQMHRHHL
ncbi:MAG: hypothetical protein WBZ36_20175 [Candidatus Nitrosopolaris sp.]